jgi:hypothetical protein
MNTQTPLKSRLLTKINKAHFQEFFENLKLSKVLALLTFTAFHSLMSQGMMMEAELTNPLNHQFSLLSGME